MKGYSIDIRKQEIIKTGVLNVETNPADADITVDGQFSGKSNKAIPNLRIGNYTVTLSKTGYYSYQRKLEILHGLASPIIVPLLRESNAAKLQDITPKDLVDSNETGYYLLEEQIAEATTATTTPTNAAVKNTRTYLLTHVSITKPFFDDPKAALDETMTITTLSSTPITDISVSPTGKLILAKLTDASGASSLSLIPFKKGTSVNANLADTKMLTFYQKDTNTQITWSGDGDYILVETPTQVISYNTKTATRLIILEKSELQLDKDTVVWNMNKSGISIAKKAQGSDLNTFELQEISYNGNPLSITVPTVQLPEIPKRIWSFGTQQRPIFVISTKAGTYVFGKLFDPKVGELDITLASTKIGETEISHFSEDFSLIQISSLAASNILYSADKHSFIIITEDKKQAEIFTINRRAADHLTELGNQSLLKSEQPLDFTYFTEDGFYFIYTKERNLFATDITGQNTYTLQSGVTSPVPGQGDSAMLYLGDDKNLYFKILR